MTIVRAMTFLGMAISMFATACGDEDLIVRAANASASLCAGQPAAQGTSTTIDIVVEGAGGAHLEFSISGLPSGVSGTFATPIEAATTVTLLATPTAPAGTGEATIHVLADESRDATTTVDVTVTGSCP